ncbi:MAG: radical SAM protein [Oscillospiraceae bacterium]|nr:radical SAM protein [Oscillospiraceae bacterium]
MRKLLINGKYEKIPAFPHPKDYALRCAQFFGAKSVFAFAKVGHFHTFTEILNSRRFECGIPRDILIDPTNACNMHCKGCWAGDYEHTDGISYERLDLLLTEAEQLGALDILYTGGEPLMRKAELIELARKHKKLFFGIFTNGTLVDDKLANEIKHAGNITLFISIEGYEEETDFRRGKGAYQKIIRAMHILKENKIAYAFSLCYHKNNYKLITSDGFLDFLRDNGAWFGWAFGYRPIGKNADMSLVLNADEREFVRERFNEYSDRHSFTIIDLFNNGHKVFGCVGGGSGYLHINAAGDVEPCAFCHYSDSNINKMTLQEALQSPFLRAFRRGQPFSDNPLTPCPLFDNPEKMVELSEKYNAVSTHFEQKESAADFADKVSFISCEWQKASSVNINKLTDNEINMFRKMKKVLSLRKKLAKDE